MIFTVTDNTFEKTVVESDHLVIVDFWAEWCGPCRMLTPILEAISEKFEDKVTVVKLDSDNNVKTTSQYGVRNIPTLLFFKNGLVVDKQVGLAPKNILESKIETILNEL